MDHLRDGIWTVGYGEKNPLVEYKIQGVNQIQVNPDIGLTFASGLRSILRQDPNVVFQGNNI